MNGLRVILRAPFFFMATFREYPFSLCAIFVDNPYGLYTTARFSVSLPVSGYSRCEPPLAANLTAGQEWRITQSWLYLF
jgi:hypothetical protein